MRANPTRIATVPHYQVIAYYPTFPGLHPLDDSPQSRSTTVEAASEAKAAIEAVVQGLLPISFSVRRSGETVAVFWHQGIYGSDEPPTVVQSAPSEVVLGFGEHHDAHRLTLAVWRDDPQDFPLEF